MDKVKLIIELENGGIIELVPDVMKAQLNSNGEPINLLESFKDMNNAFREVYVLGFEDRVAKIKEITKRE